MKIQVAIILSLVMIFSGAVIGFDHSLTGINNPNLQVVPTLVQQTAGVPVNYGSNNYGSLSISTRIGGVYCYSGTPYVASSFTQDGASTYFEGYTYLNWTLEGNCPSTTYSTITLTVTMNYEVFLASNPSYYYASGSQVYSLSVRTSPDSSSTTPGWYAGEVITISPNPGSLFLPISITGQQNGIIEVKSSFTVTANPPNADFFTNFDDQSGSVLSEAAILPSGASLSPPTPNPVVEGHSISIPYVTQFGAGGAYTLRIYGSSAYDNGQEVKNVSLTDNTDSSYTYTVPSNAFVAGASGTGNEWSISIYNDNFELITQTTFVVNTTNAEPPAPVISILSTPQGAGNTWQEGQQVELKITAGENQNTLSPISYIILSVFSGSSVSSVSTTVINNAQFPVKNGVVYVNFTMPYAPDNLYIEAQSVDSGGVASPQTLQTISSLDITAGHTNSQAPAYFSIAMLAAAFLGFAVIFIWIPGDAATKVVLAFGYGGMLLLLYLGFGGVI